MRPFDALRSGLAPAVDELRETWDQSYPQPLRGRELLVELIAAGIFVAAAAAMAAFIPSERSLDVPLPPALLATYALLSRVRFPIGYGFTVPTQVVLVPMLFLLPLGEVPLFVAAGLLPGSLPEHPFGDRHPSHAVSVLGDSLYAFAPVAVLAAAGDVAPEFSEWPGLIAALAAQVVADTLSATLRDWAGTGISPKIQPALFGWVTLVDVLLAPVGLIVAIAALTEPYAVLLVLPLAGLLFVFALERSARMRQAIELNRAYRGTTLLL